ncbi:hypothetical protein SAY86_023446 [Trapa natans]|uniref:Peptidase A1 domain-containing protein n=1 Tax=Trapa natans TaxID=22666 RepID=A0AAN7MAF0_TRANT|nr:hypothetical protein SAY86_023446 [Trapa natans]
MATSSCLELDKLTVGFKMQQLSTKGTRGLGCVGAWKVLLALAVMMALRLCIACCHSPHVEAHVFNLERSFQLNRLVDLGSIRARDEARRAQFTQGVVGGAVDFSLSGSSDPFKGGLYFTKVKIGSPPREFRVQIDTGSDVLWVACSSCTNCPRASQLGVELSFYDAISSSTSEAVTCYDSLCTSTLPTSAAVCLEQDNLCGYSFRYGDGSGTSGFYVTDNLNFDMALDRPDSVANSSAQIIFGCSTYQSGDLTMTDKAVDGIFGFGPGSTSVISQLSSKGIIPKVFSHCLKGDSGGGGILMIGEISDPDIVYTPLISSKPHYNLNMESITINGQALPIDPAAFSSPNSRETIVDSGTTLAYLVEEAFDPFVSTITAAASHNVIPVTVNGTQCYLLPASISGSFPPISLNFAGGASISLKPDEYLIRISSIEGVPLWCIGFQKTQQGVSILGDLVLKDKVVVYDLAQQRIGWAYRDCSASVNASVVYGWDKIMDAAEMSASSSTEYKLIRLLAASVIGFLLQVTSFS